MKKIPDPKKMIRIAGPKIRRRHANKICVTGHFDQESVDVSFKEIQERIALFRNEIQDIVQKPLNQANTATDHHVSKVCQLNIQFFGLAG